MRKQTSPRFGFTLMELLVVISIIAVLMALLFPAMGKVRDMARKTQAKNDLIGIVNAVKMYYTEYGKYPLPSQGDDWTSNSSTQGQLLDILRAAAGSEALNPRRIVFLEVPAAKDQDNPRGGLGGNVFYDPWGGPYVVRIDGDYDNKVDNPYSSNAGFEKVDTGVIAWSLGKDKAGGSGDRKKDTAADDVISWQ